jgi:hypothetical protein
MKLSKAKLDELTAGYKTPEQMESLYSQMLQHMINRSLEAEMQAHLGYERHEVEKRGQVLRFPHVFMPGHPVDPAVVGWGVVADR